MNEFTVTFSTQPPETFGGWVVLIAVYLVLLWLAGRALLALIGRILGGQRPRATRRAGMAIQEWFAAQHASRAINRLYRQAEQDVRRRAGY